MPNRRTILKMLGSYLGIAAIWPLGCVQNDEGSKETQQKAKDVDSTVASKPESLEPPVSQKAEKKVPGNIRERTKEIIVEQLGVDESEVTESASFIDDLGADSLDTVELVMAFEDEFDIEIPDEEAEKLYTVGEVITYLEKKIQ